MNPPTETCPWCGSKISRERFLEIQARIREEETRKAKASEAALRLELEKEFRLRLEKQRGADSATLAQAQNQLRTVQAQAEQQRLRELKTQRATLERDRDERIRKQQAEFSRERERFQKKIMALDRQVQRKTAQELGDGAEIDLFETLRDEFPDDRITRIDKGEAGADILQEILHKGDVCGRIIVDAKNRQSWQNSFVTKLRQDQVEAKAEHGVLATTTFPSGKRELCIESGVIVVNPARAVHIIRLLRNATVALHLRALSIKDRASKMHDLYKFITSEAYTKQFGEAGRLAQDILDLDVDEKKTHDNVWKRRGSLATRLSHVLRELDTDIASIIEADGSSAVSVA